MNVLKCTQRWRDVATETAKEYPDVELTHMLVDNAAMQLVKNPKQFDVMVTGNMFGDILSDEASMLTGSIGMLPSASLDANNKGLYEPSHGSAPDIAGKGVANPLATILSVAMMLRYTFANAPAAARVEGAVKKVLAQGFRTGDIFEPGMKKVGTREMGDAVLAARHGGKLKALPVPAAAPAASAHLASAAVPAASTPAASEAASADPATAAAASE